MRRHTAYQAWAIADALDTDELPPITCGETRMLFKQFNQMGSSQKKRKQKAFEKKDPLDLAAASFDWLKSEPQVKRRQSPEDVYAPLPLHVDSTTGDAVWVCDRIQTRKAPSQKACPNCKALHYNGSKVFKECFAVFPTPANLSNMIKRVCVSD